MNSSDLATVGAERVAEGRARILSELGKVIVGQDEVVEQVLIALFTGGHCLITGVPGLAKTLLIKTLAFYVHRGHELEVHEPPVRGRKGPAHGVVRHIGIRVLNPRVFDAIRWELMKRTRGAGAP